MNAFFVIKRDGSRIGFDLQDVYKRQGVGKLIKCSRDLPVNISGVNFILLIQ